MAVDFDDVSERIFHVNHAVGLFARIVVARLFHTSLAASGDYVLGEFFDVGVLHAKVKDTGFPVFKVIFRLGLVLKLKQFDTNSVTGGYVGNLEASPSGAEHIRAHLAYGAVVLFYLGGLHYQVPAHNLHVELNGLL